MANTNAAGTNYYFPFTAQLNNGVTPSGASYTFNIATSGWASQNQAGFVFQTGQYNSKREGSGN